ncbi:amidase [Bradyrhizobium sp. SSBR45G]|uniref:isochorismatase family protein n=1 Tax=unclassified Bradyrhizobium TaxID=2631580 RepID=UPI0023428D9F|nr:MULTISPECIES: isochorismatase family protein [unclassified Bradyrhizobium]GLH81537.1 amidase [Bradyrhizobium sp. SSBR45G]GLH89056.1 amidase [Bradyrhizobium sp. SSBR45R]
MSSGDLFVATETDPPVLLCADLQCEYLAEGRKHLIADGDVVTARCRQLIALWRDNLWPVVHLKRIAQAAWFNPASNLTNWLDDFKPRPGEIAFEHPLPSAYSSARFADYMSNMRSIRCIVLGFSLDETILSTVVDGFHRSHRYQVIGDAVACRKACAGDADSYKQVVTRVIGNFAGVLDSAELTGASGRLAARAGRRR